MIVELSMQYRNAVQPTFVQTWRGACVVRRWLGPSLVAGVFFWRGWMRNVGDGKGHVGWTIWCRINRIHDLIEKLGEFKALVVIGVAGGNACGCWVRRAVRWLDLALVDHFFQGRWSGNHHSSLLDLRIA
jgi:hypothetical protein